MSRWKRRHARGRMSGEESFARAAAVPQQAMPQDVRRGRKAVVIDCLLACCSSSAGGMAVRFILQGRCQVSGSPQAVVFIVFLIMWQARKSGIPDFRKTSVRRSGRIGAHAPTEILTETKPARTSSGSHSSTCRRDRWGNEIQLAGAPMDADESASPTKSRIGRIRPCHRWQQTGPHW